MIKHHGFNEPRKQYHPGCVTISIAWWISKLHYVKVIYIQPKPKLIRYHVVCFKFIKMFRKVLCLITQILSVLTKTDSQAGLTHVVKAGLYLAPR